MVYTLRVVLLLAQDENNSAEKYTVIDNNSTSMIEDLSHKLNKLKNGLSPILFMICSTKSILLINAPLWLTN